MKSSKEKNAESCQIFNFDPQTNPNEKNTDCFVGLLICSFSFQFVRTGT
jgi:hypothetical protein